MSFRITVKEEAQADISNAYLYYELLQKGLGDRFLSELIDIYERLSVNPHLYSYMYKDEEHQFRDILLDNFPYLVVYEIDAKEVIIYMVHNTYKKPKY